MMSLFVIGVTVSILGLLLFLFLGFRSHSLKKNKRGRYDLLSDFPFELYDGFPPMSLLSRIGFIFYQASFIFLGLFALTLGNMEAFKTFIIFLLIFITAKGVAYSLLLFIPASNEKGHVTSALISFALESVCAFMTGLIFFQVYNNHYQIMGLVFAILSWIICAAMLSLALNPNLSKWAKMNVVEDMDGAHMERPRPFILAFSEWIAYITDFLFFILLVVSLIFAFTI